MYGAAAAAAAIGLAALPDLVHRLSWTFGALGGSWTVLGLCAAYVLLKRRPEALRNAWMLGAAATAIAASGWLLYDWSPAQSVSVSAAGLLLFGCGLRLRAWQRTADGLAGGDSRLGDGNR